MYILTNAKETCSYDSVNNKFLLGGATSGAQNISVGLAQSADTTSIDGLPCEVTVRYIDQTQSTKFETLRGTYNSVDNSITRDSTISSSTGTGAITFDAAAGPDNLVIYGTTSHTSFGIVTLQDIYTTTGTDYSTNSTVTWNPTSDWMTVVPTNPNSYLDVQVVSDVRLVGSSSVDNLRGAMKFRREAVGATELDIGTAVLRGHVNQDTPNSDPQVYEPMSLYIRLNSSSRNDDGEWVFRTIGVVDFPNNTLNTFNQQWFLQEKLVMGA